MGESVRIEAGKRSQVGASKPCVELMNRPKDRMDMSQEGGHMFIEGGVWRTAVRERRRYSQRVDIQWGGVAQRETNKEPCGQCKLRRFKPSIMY